ncbi:sialate O-acetylesterase [Arachidicoccus sp.]|uniref:sialate O-acetylesterase n=1 Tax=Arachidicoccus sp. TaxID=1872624 RepID=UPI003D228D22
MRVFTRLSVAAFLCLFFSFSAFAKITLPTFFADNMVLQQRYEAPVWGWAKPEQIITLSGSWNNQSISTKANIEGYFMLKIKTPKAGGPYTLTIKGSQTIVLHNVMIGEVWVCSGQSNMEFPLQGWPPMASMLNSAQEIKNANYPNIRLFTVKRDIALSPQQNCEGNWSECNPQSVAPFSATAYFFGRALYQKLKVPIGLIETCWGGTVAEAWTSNSALRKLGDFDSALNKLDSLSPIVKKVEKQYKDDDIAWQKASVHINDQFKETNFEDHSWKTMALPTTWEKAGYPDLDGIVWFRKEINIPASWVGKPLKLNLGPVDDNDITWFNGQKIGATDGWLTPRSYDIPGNMVKAGVNVIAIRVTDAGGNGGIYGEKDALNIYPAGSSSNNGINLSSNWKYKIAFVKHNESLVTQNPNNPAVLYNGMIAPLIPFAIKGAIWYQGESNVGRATQYARLFPDMIEDWRTRWHEGSFPFYFVQIAPFPYGSSGVKSAALRDAQRATLQLPNTGMAVTLDIGDTTNIHPSHKQEVGRRIALWALSNTYGEKGIVYSGPLYKSMKIEGNKIAISFKYSDGGLDAKGGTLNSFEIAGDDGRFVPAAAFIQGNKVIVSAASVAHPMAVRYAWSDKAVPHLFNKAGLPASTFITNTSLYRSY